MGFYRIISPVFGWVIFLSVCSAHAQKYISEGAKIKAQGDSCYMAGNRAEAEKYYVKEWRLYQKHRDNARASYAQINVAVMQLGKADYAKTIQLLHEARAVVPTRTEVDSTRFKIYNYLGLAHKRNNRFDSCQFYYDKATHLLETSKTIRDYGAILSYYTNQSVWEIDKGNYERAELLLQKAQQILPLDTTFNASVVYHNLGFVALQNKRYDMAIKAFEKTILTQPYNHQLPLILANKGLCLLKLKRLKEAKIVLDQAWRSYQTYLKNPTNKPDSYFLTVYYGNLGLYFLEESNLTNAQRYFLKSTTLNETSQSAALSEGYKYLGLIAEKQAHWPQALTYYQKALIAAHETFNSADIYQNPDLDRILTERELFRALMGKANAFRQFYTQTRQRRDLEAALKTYQLAIQLAEKMRRSYQSAGAKLFFTENYYAVYEQAIQTAQELFQLTQKPDYQNLIFDFYEKSRAASLSDIIRDADLKPKTINAALLAQEKGLYQQITGLQTAIKRSDSTSAVKFKAQLVDKEIELDRLTKRFEREFPAYYQLKFDIQTPTTATIQQQLLSSDAALIQYFLTSSQLYTLVLTREQANVLVQPVDSIFRQSISKFRALLSLNPGSKAYDGRTYSSAIYSKLITPALPFISTKKRLLIVRDAELNYLPFEVLAAKSNDYLLKKYAISYAYSVGLLMNKPARSSTNSRLAIAPFAGNIPQKTPFRGVPLVPLPASEEEVRQIGGDVYLEKEATKKRFLEQYRKHGIIHFATHALTDDKDPMRSFVAFYPDGQEYRLFTNELYDLDLKEAQLVVLSACETGAGKLQRGEGVMSLARAFSYAGAHSVATTLWNANDEATAYISTHFHEYINEGLPLDEALQRAKLDFLHSDLGRRYDHPYYWANMVLIGRTDPIQRGVSFWWWVVGGIVLVLGIEELLKHRKTTQKSPLR